MPPPMMTTSARAGSGGVMRCNSVMARRCRSSRAGDRLQRQRTQHHRAAHQRPECRHLADDQPRPDRGQHHLGLGQEREVGGGQVAGADGEGDEAAADLDDAHDRAGEQVVAADRQAGGAAAEQQHHRTDRGREQGSDQQRRRAVDRPAATKGDREQGERGAGRKCQDRAGEVARADAGSRYHDDAEAGQRHGQPSHGAHRLAQHEPP